jgi:hypothetical protein
MLNEYKCPDCEIEEYEFSIIPKKKCPICGIIMNCEEELEV